MKRRISSFSARLGRRKKNKEHNVMHWPKHTGTHTHTHTHTHTQIHAHYTHFVVHTPLFHMLPYSHAGCSDHRRQSESISLSLLSLPFPPFPPILMNSFPFPLPVIPTSSSPLSLYLLFLSLFPLLLPPPLIITLSFSSRVPVFSFCSGSLCEDSLRLTSSGMQVSYLLQVNQTLPLFLLHSFTLTYTLSLTHIRTQHTRTHTHTHTHIHTHTHTHTCSLIHSHTHTHTNTHTHILTCTHFHTLLHSPRLLHCLFSLTHMHRPLTTSPSHPDIPSPNKLPSHHHIPCSPPSSFHSITL